MRLSVFEAQGRSLARLATILATTTFLAGCSSGVTRFSDGIFTDDILTGSTANQRAIIGPNVSQPFPGDVQAAAAPAPVERYGAPARGAVTPATSGVQRTSLPPATMRQAEPVATARAEQPALDRTVTNTTAPRPAEAAGEPDVPQEGWTRAGGTMISVRQGETVYNLSKRFGVPVAAILKANGMSSASDLQTGQKLVIPSYVYSNKAPISMPDADPRVAEASSTRGLKSDVPAQRVPLPTPAPTQNVAILPQTPKPREDAARGGATTGQAATGDMAADESVYTVVSGDTLHGIARKTGTTTAALKTANGLSDGYLRIGQKLRLPPRGSATVASARPAPTGVDPVVTGSNRRATAAEEKAPVNAYTPPVRDEKVIREATQSAAVAPDATGIGRMRWPVRGRVIEGYGRASGGRVNDGIDIAVPKGTPVKAAENGVVIYAGDGLKEFGNTVLVRHEDGLVTVYGHASDLKVQRGDKVRRGQEIALSGMSGSADVPKLHFEVRKDSAPVDPATFLE